MWLSPRKLGKKVDSSSTGNHIVGTILAGASTSFERTGLVERTSQKNIGCGRWSRKEEDENVCEWVGFRLPGAEIL